MEQKTQRVYVASSWRNQEQPEIVRMLRAEGYEVYDFKNPPGRTGFGWRQIDADWQNWNVNDYLAALDTPLAQAGFESDMGALAMCDICVLVLPCGRSAHLKLGYAAGAGMRTVVYMPKMEEAELMYKMCDHIVTTPEDLVRVLREGE